MALVDLMEDTTWGQDPVSNQMSSVGVADMSELTETEAPKAVR